MAALRAAHPSPRCRGAALRAPRSAPPTPCPAPKLERCACRHPHVKLRAAALERGGAGAAQAAAAATQPPRKRTLLDAIAGDEPTLHIQVAFGARLAAHRELLQFFSTCVKGLPAGAADWDVSGLLLDGRPASRAVVAAWLEAAYAGSTYADPGAAESIERVGGEADPIDVLLFADAVGSSMAVNRACYERCADALGKLDKGIIGDKGLALLLDGSRYAHCNGFVFHCTRAGAPGTLQGQPIDAKDAVELRAQVASQLERRLYAAYKLGLQDLESKVHAFIKGNASDERGSLLTFKALDEAVLSQRVVAAAAGDSRRIRRSLAAGILSGAPARP
jgi:hypothetical protein